MMAKQTDEKQDPAGSEQDILLQRINAGLTGGQAIASDVRALAATAPKGSRMAITNAVLPQYRARFAAALDRADRRIEKLGVENATTIRDLRNCDVVQEYKKLGVALDAALRDPARLQIENPPSGARTAFLLDNDGTFADSESVALENAHAMLDAILMKHGGKAVSSDKVVAGTNLSQMVRNCAAEQELDIPDQEIEATAADEHNQLAEKFQKDGLRPTKSAKEFTIALKNGGHPVGIVTSAHYDRARPSIEAMGCTALFGDHVYSGASMGKPKPDPTVYEHAMGHMDVTDKDITIAIEDSGGGMTSAETAGVDILIGMTGGSHVKDRKALGDKLLANGATIVVDSFAQALLALRNMGLVSISQEWPITDNDLAPFPDAAAPPAQTPPAQTPPAQTRSAQTPAAPSLGNEVELAVL